MLDVRLTSSEGAVMDAAFTTGNARKAASSRLHLFLLLLQVGFIHGVREFLVSVMIHRFLQRPRDVPHVSIETEVLQSRLLHRLGDEVAAMSAFRRLLREPVHVGADRCYFGLRE